MKLTDAQREELKRISKSFAARSMLLQKNLGKTAAKKIITILARLRAKEG